MAITADKQGAIRLGAVFSASFSAFCRHVTALVILSEIAHIPSLLLFLLYLRVRDAPALSPFFASVFSQMIVDMAFGVGVVCVLSGYGAVIYGVLEDLAGRRVSIADTLVIATRRLLPLLSASFAAVVIGDLAAGPVLPRFIIYPIYWLVVGVYFVAAPVCIAEQAGIGAALSRSLFLTQGHRWQIFVVLLLIAIVREAGAPVAWGVAYLSGWGAMSIMIMMYSIWGVIDAFSAVIAAIFYDTLRSAKDGGHLAKVVD